MIKRITPRPFHEASGGEDRRVLFDGGCAHFRTGSFAAGVVLADAIGRLADATPSHPDVDVRSAGVTVRLVLFPRGLFEAKGACDCGRMANDGPTAVG